MFVFKISLVFASIVFYSDGTTSWSNWTSCSPQENSCLKSFLECNVGKEIQCVTGTLIDQRLFIYKTTVSGDCNETCDGHNNERWTNTFVRV